MKIHLHQTHQTIADFTEIFTYLHQQLLSGKSGLHLFPECYLNGYPLQDLCLQQSYIDHYQQILRKIDQFCGQMELDSDTLFLLGGLEYQRSASGIPQKIFNALYTLSPGQPLVAVYRKQLLPSYDIFDESKYFTPGIQNKTLYFQKKKIGLLICEDMWPSLAYQRDPISQWVEDQEQLDLIINLSASPFHLEKAESRIRRAQEISHLLQAPFAYVNRVGGEDEILFDGGSFVANGDDVLVQCPYFHADHQSLDLPHSQKSLPSKATTTINAETTLPNWESLFAARLNKKNPSRLLPWPPQQLEMAIQAMQFGLQEYARKNGFQRFLLALSGGIDSALVLAVAKLGLRPPQSIEALYMPGPFSSHLSYELSQELCQNLGVPCKTLPIKFLYATCRNTFITSLETPLTGLADENIQGRLRSTLLYARSNQTAAMVLNTSNKSELSVGYSTQYGDSVGAISLLGDFYKSEVYQLAHYLNENHAAPIPLGIIQRPPTAELKADQKDSDWLPEYPVLDAILEGLLSYRMNPEDLIQFGHQRQDVEKVVYLHTQSEFKRAQFCPIYKNSGQVLWIWPSGSHIKKYRLLFPKKGGMNNDQKQKRVCKKYLITFKKRLWPWWGKKPLKATSIK